MFTTISTYTIDTPIELIDNSPHFEKSPVDRFLILPGESYRFIADVGVPDASLTLEAAGMSFSVKALTGTTLDITTDGGWEGRTYITYADRMLYDETTSSTGLYVVELTIPVEPEKHYVVELLSGGERFSVSFDTMAVPSDFRSERSMDLVFGQHSKFPQKPDPVGKDPAEYTNAEKVFAHYNSFPGVNLYADFRSELYKARELMANEIQRICGSTPYYRHGNLWGYNVDPVKNEHRVFETLAFGINYWRPKTQDMYPWGNQQMKDLVVKAGRAFCGATGMYMFQTNPATWQVTRPEYTNDYGEYIPPKVFRMMDLMDKPETDVERQYLISETIACMEYMGTFFRSIWPDDADMWRWGMFIDEPNEKHWDDSALRLLKLWCECAFEAVFPMAIACPSRGSVTTLEKYEIPCHTVIANIDNLDGHDWEDWSATYNEVMQKKYGAEWRDAELHGYVVHDPGVYVGQRWGHLGDIAEDPTRSESTAMRILLHAWEYDMKYVLYWSVDAADWYWSWRAQNHWMNDGLEPSIRFAQWGAARETLEVCKYIVAKGLATKIQVVATLANSLEVAGTYNWLLVARKILNDILDGHEPDPDPEYKMISASISREDGILVEWSDVPGATGHKLWYNDDVTTEEPTEGWYPSILLLDVETYLDLTVEPGGKRRYRTDYQIGDQPWVRLHSDVIGERLGVPVSVEEALIARDKEIMAGPYAVHGNPDAALYGKLVELGMVWNYNESGREHIPDEIMSDGRVIRFVRGEKMETGDSAIVWCEVPIWNEVFVIPL